MAQRRMTFARLQALYRRQDPPAWGTEYQPSILATREEAPAISRAAQLWIEKLGRYAHCLSGPEQAVLRLAAFHPNLFELQEQRMLPVDRRPHPLTGHARATGMDLPSLQGTIAVAERLDVLRFHGWLRRLDPNTGDDQLVPVPFIGDFLLFLADDQGPYCVNWTVKQANEDFSRSISIHRRIRDEAKDSRSANARHAVEEQLYLDAGIRTVRVVTETIPAQLDHNLSKLFLHQRTFNPLPDHIDQELEDRIRACTRSGEPPQAVLLGVSQRHGCAYQDVRQAFFRILWERRVRVEMFEQDILVDKPLLPERRDVVAHYGHLFNREV